MDNRDLSPEEKSHGSRTALYQIRQERDDLARTVAGLYRINQQLENENDRLKSQRDDLLDRINQLKTLNKAKGN